MQEDVAAALRAQVEQIIGKVTNLNDDPTDYSWRQAQDDRGREMNAFAVPYGASAAGSGDREARWWDSYSAAIADGHDSYDAERIADAEVPPRQQCTGPVYSASLSAPERCALPEDHEGECTP